MRSDLGLMDLIRRNDDRGAIAARLRKTQPAHYYSIAESPKNLFWSCKSYEVWV